MLMRSLFYPGGAFILHRPPFSGLANFICLWRCVHYRRDIEGKARCSRWPAQRPRCPLGPNCSLKRMFKYQCCIIIAGDLNLAWFSCPSPSSSSSQLSARPYYYRLTLQSSSLSLVSNPASFPGRQQHESNRPLSVRHRKQGNPPGITDSPFFSPSLVG